MDFYMAMIVQFAGNFAPRNFMYCNGQIISIAQNTALFSLLGTTFGGNGQTTFSLPDLRGRAAIGPGQGPGLPTYVQGEMAGSPTTTLSILNMPAHNHAAVFTPTGSPTVNVTALSGVANGSQAVQPTANAQICNAYDATNFSSASIFAPAGTAGTAVNLSAGNVAGIAGSVTVGVTGNSQPFDSMQPYLGLQSIICTAGIFPSRN
ncbi:phage tail protein [Caulobacter sp. 602-2]|uniref:Phage tail protein n=1 Tax=Caulobacter sp. 602-2 TaxID=2710887 RepID=A0A6G4R226_9CAUL|nr:tail fiber protein [Caulobacter sp. 602-2]NGM51976.1 phage tail protein [Caulobacter sp. 602-2]